MPYATRYYGSTMANKRLPVWTPPFLFLVTVISTLVALHYALVFEDWVFTLMCQKWPTWACP